MIINKLTVNKCKTHISHTICIEFTHAARQYVYEQHHSLGCYKEYLFYSGTQINKTRSTMTAYEDMLIEFGKNMSLIVLSGIEHKLK